MSPMNDLTKAFKHIEKNYSPALKDMILYLISNPSPSKSIDGIIQMLAPKMAEQLNFSLL
jgi:PAB-dependent poly(A)-specific ribonuclease subunit 3